jgi:pyruvate dehydrogenase E1 component beta subunit
MLSYCEAINEALFQEMERDDSVFVYGIGIADHKKIFGSTERLLETFGPGRCIETPLSEDAMTGLGLGAAINGLRPIHVHIRVDFLLLAMNQIANMVSSMRYGTGGELNAPMVIRAIVGRGWGQGFQHSKSLHGMFAHIPGLKVVMPTTPYDAKGMMISAIRDNDPVLVFEHRWLYWQKGHVPNEPYTVPLGQGCVTKEGRDLTIVGTSWLNVEALQAMEIMGRRGVSIELVDPRSAYPLDLECIARSVDKTGHCLVADNDWGFCGFGSEVAASVSERCFKTLKSPVRRIGFPHTPCPTARHLENEFYPNARTIVRTVEEMMGMAPADLSKEEFYCHERRFKGPF